MRARSLSVPLPVSISLLALALALTLQLTPPALICGRWTSSPQARTIQQGEGGAARAGRAQPRSSRHMHAALPFCLGRQYPALCV
eukprot:4995245-Pleurochrysis_carterae.AAC.2